MVDLMLQADREQPVDLALVGLALGVLPACTDPVWPHHLGILLGNRKAALVVGHQGLRLLEDLRIDEHPRVLDRLALFLDRLHQVDHQHAPGHPDLDCSEPDPGGFVHRLEHVGDQRRQRLVEAFNGERGLAK